MHVLTGDPKYAQIIYDDMADNFEDKLVKKLGYRGPWELFDLLQELLDDEFSQLNGDIIKKKNIQSSIVGSEELKNDEIEECSLRKSKYPKEGSWRILDLGCGSGLVGKIFQKYSNCLIADSCDGDVNEVEVEKSNVDLVVVLNTTTSNNSCNNDDSKNNSNNSNNTNNNKDNNDDNDNSNSDNNNNNNNDNYNDNRNDDEDLRQLNILQSSRIKEGACMIGVDVSMKMVEITRKTNCYTSVARADLCEALKIFQCSNHDDSDANNNKNDDNTTYDNININKSNITDKNSSDNSNTKSNKYDIRSNDNTNNTSLSNSNQINTTNTSKELGSTNSTLLDMIIVADTFIYVGTLGAVFVQIKQSLKKNGLFLFSIEDLDSSPMKIDATSDERTVNVNVRTDNEIIDIHDTDDNIQNIIKLDEMNKMKQKNSKGSKITDYEIDGAVPGWGGQLLKSARFAHSNSYIQILADIHGFQILKMKIVILRTEETIPLYGRLYVLQIVL